LDVPLLNLEDLRPDATVRGILPDAAVTVVSVEWHGSDTVTVKKNEILYSFNKPDDFIPLADLLVWEEAPR
jgi:hypothetical protein